jgi:hypothetical protein
MLPLQAIKLLYLHSVLASDFHVGVFFLCTEAVSGDGMESACRGKCGFNLSLYAKRMVSSPHLRRSGSGKLWLGRFQWPCLVMQCFVDAEPFVTAGSKRHSGPGRLAPTGKACSSFLGFASGANRGRTAAAQQSAHAGVSWKPG